MRSRAGLTPVVVLAVVALLLTGCSRPGGGPGPGAGAPPMGTNGAPVPALDWRACGGGQCADVVVPLDYRRPGGPTITLAALRMPATDPAARLGTLVVNYGGPGSPGTASLRRLAGRFEALRARFDLLTIDPRGTGGSAPVTCGPFGGERVPAPVGPARTPAFWASAAEPGRACLAGTGERLGHLSTANAARDVDLVRQALGEETVSLYGYSYGTYSAATYANLFPSHTRAMVLDGSLDLVANAAGAPGTERLPVDVRAGVSEAWEEAFGVALDGCAATPTCPLGPDARARATDVVAAAAAGTLPGTTSAELVARIDRALQTEGRLPGLMRALAALAPGAPPSGGRVPLPAQPWAPEHSPSYLAIQCTDSVTPSAADMDAAVVAEQAAHPVVGASTALNHAMCVGWPAIDPDRYLGPWNAPLAAPALLVNSRYDSTTPLIDARATASQLAAAHVLVVDAIGHTTLDAPSRCATEAYTAYLLDPRVTPPDRCPAGR
ncbi:alpha/beta hydrolase [Actinomycetospora straminea]|uniref:Alpha/beta hydrolase n=1 Tax=Actinomycetospora straminea TaxID=663607 RepID=A0ABP9E415_9PSEU|nr:alpha/beta hydrolase [Actinomycetospora straminea]MDD7932703.1 alpha/beta hydrolase [Actinomycetospora straminea]